MYGVCHCENIPLSRLLGVILGNSFQCRKYLTEAQVAEASWLAEKVDYHISGEGYLLVSEIWVSAWCLILNIVRLQ